MGIIDAVGESLFHPLMAGAERAWDLCFKPERRQATLTLWRERRGWQNLRTAVEVGTLVLAVGLCGLVVAVPLVLLMR